MIKNLRPEALLLAVAAFLAPVIGGHVSTDARPLFEGLIGEILGGGGLPLTARFLVGALVIAAFGLALRNRVVQIPNLRLLALLTALLFVFGATVLITDFRSVAFREWQSWLLYASTFLATITIAGRQKNVRLLLAVIGTAVSIVALKGIGEYVQIMAQEPTYRIFADWNNPNAVASLFILGSLVLLGLAAAEEGRNRLFALLGASLTVLALILTQSKGGYLAFGVGLVALLAFLFGFKQPKKLGFALAPVLVGVILAFALGQAAQSQSQGGQALARITDTGSTAEQSAGFRQNLWKTSLQLAQDHPAGTGIGTFRYYSAQPGLTDQTVFAHQTFLQTLAEGGILSLAVFLAFAALWFYLVVRQTQVQPDQTRALKAGVLAAVVGFGAHGMVESNLSFFGTAFLFFILLALGLQLATDATSPESMPSGVRTGVAVVLCFIPFVLLALTASGEIKKATFRTAMERGDAPLLASLAEGLKSPPYNDPEALYLASFSPEYAPNPASPPKDQPNQISRLSLLDRAVQGLPSPMFLRAAAAQARLLGDTDRALAYLDQIAVYHPTNLPAGLLKIEILDEARRYLEAQKAAQDLIQAESTVAFQVRAIPEIVPTQTLEARIYLAQTESDPQTLINLLQPTVDSYLDYKAQTYSKLLWMKEQMQKADPSTPVEDRQVAYGGERLDDAIQKLLKSQQAAIKLAEAYAQLGDLTNEQSALQAAADLVP